MSSSWIFLILNCLVVASFSKYFSIVTLFLFFGSISGYANNFFANEELLQNSDNLFELIGFVLIIVGLLTVNRLVVKENKMRS